jgi:hypothetical protein
MWSEAELHGEDDAAEEHHARDHALALAAERHQQERHREQRPRYPIWDPVEQPIVGDLHRHGCENVNGDRGRRRGLHDRQAEQH